MTTKKITKIISTENGDNYVADIEDIENRITQNSSNLETAKQELSNKCDTVLSDAKAYTDTKKNEALSQAKAYTDQEKAKYLPLTGGTVKNSYIDSSDKSGLFRLEKETGAMLFLFDVNSAMYKGGAILRTVDKDAKFKDLQIKNDGSFTWCGLNVVRSVNGALADDNGNAVVISHTIQSTNNFASTFLHNNMALKIQCIRISGNQGQQFGTINWLLPFADTNYHVFVTSEDPDENLYFQIADVTLVGKTTTSCKVGHKVEDIQQFYTGGFISVVGIGY